MMTTLLHRSLRAAALTALLAGRSAAAQTPAPSAPAAGSSQAQDPAERLRQVLPPDVAERVLATVAEARSRELPARALEQRALKFAARGVAPAAVERAVAEQAGRMGAAKAALEQGRAGGRPSGPEIEAGAEALRQGVDGAAVSALAKSAPSGRSLAVPLYVAGQLAAGGLPADQALARVRERLGTRASDAELEALPAQALAGRGQQPAALGRELANTRRPGNAGGAGAAGGPPGGIPVNGGAGARPVAPVTPVTPPATPPVGGRP